MANTADRSIVTGDGGALLVQSDTGGVIINTHTGAYQFGIHDTNLGGFGLPGAAAYAAVGNLTAFNGVISPSGNLGAVNFIINTSNGERFGLVVNQAGGAIISFEQPSVGETSRMVIRNTYHSIEFDIRNTRVMQIGDGGGNNRYISIGNSGTTVNETTVLRFYELSTSGNDFVGLQAPDNITTSVVWRLPAADGASGQVLQTNGSGNLSWTSSLPVSEQQFMLTDHAISVTGAWQNIGLGITLPSAGTWLIRYVIRGEAAVTAGATADTLIAARLFNAATLTALVDSEIMVTQCPTNARTGDTVTGVLRVAVAGVTSVQVQAIRQTAATFSFSSIRSNANGRSSITYERVS